MVSISIRGQALIIIPAPLAGRIVRDPFGMAGFNHVHGVFDHLAGFALTMRAKFSGRNIVLAQSAGDFSGGHNFLAWSAGLRPGANLLWSSSTPGQETGAPVATNHIASKPRLTKIFVFMLIQDFFRRRTTGKDAVPLRGTHCGRYDGKIRSAGRNSAERAERPKPKKNRRRKE